MVCKANELAQALKSSGFMTKAGLTRKGYNVTVSEIIGRLNDIKYVPATATAKVKETKPVKSSSAPVMSKKELHIQVKTLKRDIRKLDTDNDNILQYIARNGGINLVETKTESGGVSDIQSKKQLARESRVSYMVGSKRVTKQAFYVTGNRGELSWDDLSELMGLNSDMLDTEVEEYIMDKLANDMSSFLDPTVGAEMDSLVNELDMTVEALENMAGKESPTQKQVDKKNSEAGIQMTIDGLNRRFESDDADMLGSDLEFMADMQNADRLILDLHNNPEGVVELAKSIDNMDDKHGTKSTNSKFLLSLIESMAGTLKEISPLIHTAINKSASKNQGRITGLAGKTMDLELSVGPGDANRTGLEVYAEELVHAITGFGLSYTDPKMRGLVTEIEEIRETFFSSTTVNQLAKMMPDSATAKADAEKLLDYVSSGNNSTKEFVAKAVSNPYIMQVLRDTLTKKADYTGESMAAKFVAWLQKVFRYVRGAISREPTSNDLDRMMYFVAKMGDINAKALNTKKKGVLANVAEFINEKVDKRAAAYIIKLREKSNDLKVPKVGLDVGKFGIAMYWAKLIPFSLINDRARDVMRIQLSTLGHKPWETLQMTADDILDSDQLSDELEASGMAKYDADRISALTELSIVKELKAGFGRELSVKEQRGLLQVMKIDPVALDGMNMEELFNSDSKELNKQIASIESELVNKHSESDSNYYKIMTSMLGRYMSTGETNKVMLKNAYSIANKMNVGGSAGKASQELIDMVDKLASLQAIKNIPVGLRLASKEFLEDTNNEVGTASVIKYLVHNKQKSQKELFGKYGEAHLYTKGYMSDIYDNDQEVLIRPLSEADALAKDGYKLQAEMEHDYLLRDSSTKFGIFTSDYVVKNRLHSAGFKYNSLKHRGTSITDQYMMSGEDITGTLARRDISREKLESSRILNRIIKGNYKESDKDKGMSPILNPQGDVVDYSYEMTHYNKEMHLGLRTNPIERLSKTARSVVDKVETEIHNQILVKQLVDEMDANTKKADLLNAKGETVYSKVNGKSYRLINGESSVEEFRDLWFALPKTVRMKFKGHKDSEGNVVKPEGMYIREDHIRAVMGFRELSIADNKYTKKFKPETRMKIRVAEEIWKNVVSISKVGIVLKMPFVLINNVVSNFAIVVSYLENPVEVAKLQMQGVQEINKYTTLHKELMELEARLAAGMASKEDVRQIARVKKRMEDSPMKPLVDAGFFTQILEETELQEHRAKIVEKWSNEKLKNVPGIIKSGLDWAFLTDKNMYHKFMYTSTQYSDLAARYAQYQLMKRKGHSEKDMFKTLRNAFINYNKPNSPLIEWANQVGLIMFTKYYIRIQRFLLMFGKENPLKTILLLITDEVLQDPATVNDSSILNNGVLHLLKNPVDIAVTAITPGMGLAIGDITN